ncbi:MAG: hypothetical protein JW941_12310 [Candidatus Coatesbacteria bacterium]|nr:hypothetical protein [Candidatus Coatesbacteria bacterium]
MKRILQIAVIILSGWLCVTAVRPFLTQVDLEWGKRGMDQAVQMSNYAQKNKKPITAALRVLNEAEKRLETAKRITLGDGQVWLFLAHITNFELELNKDISKSREKSLQEQIISIVDEAQSFYIDNMMFLRRALAYARLNKMLEAIKDLELALYYYSTWSQATRPLVSIYMQEVTRQNTKEPVRILRAMERLADRFTDNYDAVLHLGKIYLSRKRAEEARLCFDEAGQRKAGNVEIGKLIAQSYLQEQNATQSVWELCKTLYFSRSTKSKELNPIIGSIRQFLRQNPNNPDAYFIMGAVQQDRLADFNAAKRDLINSYKARNTHFETVKRLAEVSERLGEKEEAAKWRGVADVMLAHSKPIELKLKTGRKREAHCLFVANADEIPVVIGKVEPDKDASSGKAIKLSKNNGQSVPIALNCPPLPAGVYELSIRLKVDKILDRPRAKLAKIWLDGDSVSRPGSIRKANQFIYAGDFKKADDYVDFTLEFYHPGLVDYQIWMEYWAACDMSIDRVTVGFVED